MNNEWLKMKDLLLDWTYIRCNTLNREALNNLQSYAAQNELCINA